MVALSFLILSTKHSWWKSRYAFSPFSTSLSSRYLISSLIVCLVTKLWRLKTGIEMRKGISRECTKSSSLAPLWSAQKAPLSIHPTSGDMRSPYGPWAGHLWKHEKCWRYQELHETICHSVTISELYVCPTMPPWLLDARWIDCSSFVYLEQRYWLKFPHLSFTTN